MDPLTMGLLYGGGSLLSGVGGMLGSQTQANAARSAGQMGWLGSVLAANAAETGYGRAKEALSPYAIAGSKSLGILTDALTGTGALKAGIGGGGNTLMSTFAPTQQQLEGTPGYQWAREQALGGMANTGAARGMGLSGNVIQDIGKTATGLASQTFQQQLQNYMLQNQQAFNMLFDPAKMGLGAAGSIANAATGAAGQIGSAAMGAGNALGQSIYNAGTSLGAGTNALFGAAGSAMQVPYLASLYSKRNDPSPAASSSSTFTQMLPDFLRYVFGSSGNLPSNVVGGLGDRPVPTYY